jgi:ATP-dependent DNA ligase
MSPPQKHCPATSPQLEIGPYRYFSWRIRFRKARHAAEPEAAAAACSLRNGHLFPLYVVARPRRHTATPIRVSKPPVGPQWVHEIKHDGYRLIARKRDGGVRLFTRRG